MTKSEVKKIPLRAESNEVVGSSQATTKSALSPRIKIKASTEDSSALEGDNKRLQEELKTIYKENERVRSLIAKNQ